MLTFHIYKEMNFQFWSALVVIIIIYILLKFSLYFVGFFGNDILTIVCYLMQRPCLKNSISNIINSKAGKVVHTFPKGYSPKVNITAKLKFELTSKLQYSTLAITPPFLLSFIYQSI